ncbi:MAG: hydrogenase iron-sulfur subunit, partial [Promethearchaeota archaeon]
MVKSKENDHASGESPDEFDPFILGIFCNWCTYTGCDQAGTSRMQRPPNLRVMRVMCSGRVEPEMIIDALRRGADGVLVGACHIG